MARIKPPASSPCLVPLSLVVLLLLHAAATTTTTAAAAGGASGFTSHYAQYKTLLSLSHSLLRRVSNLRAARGDVSGAGRAKVLAESLERGLGLGFWGFSWKIGWDYLKNYAWRGLDYGELHGAVSDLNELAGFLGELTGARSDAERAAWVGRNYGNVLRVVKSASHRFLKVFRQSGALRQVAETVEKEVVDGGLLRDCLELGSNDLKGLVQIVKDWASLLNSSTSSHRNTDL